MDEIYIIGLEPENKIKKRLRIFKITLACLNLTLVKIKIIQCSLLQ
jgi:hypothetical protein